MAKKGNRTFIPYEEEKQGPSWFWVIVTLCVPGLQWLGLMLLGSKLYRQYKGKKKSDYRSYAAIIGRRIEVDLRELSDKLGKSTIVVRSDLQAMIDRGYFGPGAYIDRKRDFFIADADEVEATYANVSREPADQQPRVVLEKRPEKAAEPAAAEPPRAQKPQPQKKSIQNEDFEAILRKMHDLNEQIADEEVSRSIDEIGSLTADIFRVVRSKPEKADEVRKFMNYYLPLTLKLLEDYALMEKQSYQGKNIKEARDKIENLLKTLITAFQNLLEKLFSTEALDVEADVKVLETMVAKDGLAAPAGTDLRRMMQGR
ncbi:MAG: hypothetical protein E7317_08745 [Clostridiales bacterium]|nr:hypothetical protein [Clostridiales bacterium]